MAFSRIEQKSRKSGSTQETSTRVGTSRFYSGIWCAYWDLILALVVIASFGMAGCGENNMYGNGKPITRNGGGGGSNPTSSAPTTSSASATGYDISYIGVPQYSCSRNWYLSPSGSDSNVCVRPSTRLTRRGVRFYRLLGLCVAAHAAGVRSATS